MAKDVDLSSHKWRELVFEGKNKEFGAYQMRKDSNRRHGLAMLIVGAALAVILTIVILAFNGVFGGGEVVDPNAGVDQAMVNLANEEETPEEEQIEEVIEEPEPEPEPEVEEVAQQKVTELSIDDDKNVKADKEFTEIEKDNDAAFTAKDVKSDNPDMTRAIGDLMDQGPAKPAPPSTSDPEPPAPPAPAPPAPDPDENKVFTTVEQKAMYPGGDAALLAWINSNIQYPTMAQEEGAQGRVIISFVVEKDGSITDVKVARGRHPELDKEALRVVKKIPKKFTPAKQNGKNVRYKFNLPVTFKLSN